MGIETNFGTYVGKMDILSSLATLSYDKRRSEFFSNELLILLSLIEKDQIDYKTLYGSWAGAFGLPSHSRSPTNQRRTTWMSWLGSTLIKLKYTL